MITDPKKTPEVIYVQENMAEKLYGVNQDYQRNVAPGCGMGRENPEE